MPMTKINPQFLQANWGAPSNIKTLITTSTPEFNLASYVGDHSQLVFARRELLQQITPTPPLWLQQTHGIRVINWDEQSYTSPPNADASLTTQAKKVCVVLTADCLPILLTNQNGDFVAAIHAGWRGLNNGIISATLAKLAPYATQQMLAFIGPAIGEECFEVDKDVRERFSQNDPHVTRYFTISPNGGGKYLANLREIAAHQLQLTGLTKPNIFNPNICTKCNQQWFYSHRAKPMTGRFATMIWKTN